MWHQACKLNLRAQLTEEHSIGVTLNIHAVFHHTYTPKKRHLKYWGEGEWGWCCVSEKNKPNEPNKLKERDGHRMRLSFEL